MKKHKLLEEAMREYPAGITFENVYKASGVYRINDQGDIPNMELVNGIWRVNGYVYYQGVWAPIADTVKNKLTVKRKSSSYIHFKHITFSGPHGSGKTTKLEKYLLRIKDKSINEGLEIMVERLNSCSELANYTLITRIPYSRNIYDRIVFVVDGAKGDFRGFASMISKRFRIPVLLLQTVLTK